MLLKCIHEHTDVSTYTGSGFEPIEYPFKVGKIYEVAEIYEHPGHVMVRAPGATKWPKPGDPTFNWHPCEVFEPTNEPIEILSCGYAYEDYCNDMFGVVIDNPSDVARLKHLTDELQFRYELEDLDDYQTWRNQFALHLPLWLAEAWYELETSSTNPDVAYFTNLIFGDGLKWLFVAVGFHYREMVTSDMRKAEAAQEVVGYLAKLRIQCPIPDHLSLQFWAGDGSPRLINPPEFQ